MDAWESFVASLIEGIVEVSAPADCRSLARQILGMIDGLNAHALVNWRDADDRLALLTRSVEALLRLPPGALLRSAPSSVSSRAGSAAPAG
jgi:hypothetical protein